MDGDGWTDGWRDGEMEKRKAVGRRGRAAGIIKCETADRSQTTAAAAAAQLQQLQLRGDTNMVMVDLAQFLVQQGLQHSMSIKQ
jgi:hypothetical protein